MDRTIVIDRSVIDAALARARHERSLATGHSGRAPQPRGERVPVPHSSRRLIRRHRCFSKPTAPGEPLPHRPVGLVSSVSATLETIRNGLRP